MKWKDIENRKGWFIVQRGTLIDFPDCVLAIFQEIIPLECVYLPDADAYQYRGVSLKFDPLEEGMAIPEYNIFFSGKNISSIKRVEYTCHCQTQPKYKDNRNGVKMNINPPLNILTD